MWVLRRLSIPLHSFSFASARLQRPLVQVATVHRHLRYCQNESLVRDVTQSLVGCVTLGRWWLFSRCEGLPGLGSESSPNQLHDCVR